MKQLENLPNVCRKEKNNSKQTNYMIEKYFLAFTIKWFVLGIYCFTSYYTSYFPVALHLVILFSLKISQLVFYSIICEFQLGNLTDFFFFIFTTDFYAKVKLIDHITRSISQIIWFRGNSFPGTKGKFIFPKTTGNFINPKSLK